MTEPVPPPVKPPWILTAEKYLGLAEGPGAQDNPRVVKFYAECGHPEVKHDAVPWCAAFVGGVLAETPNPSAPAAVVVGPQVLETHLKGTGSLMALSYKDWGQHLDRPIYGAIGCKTRVGAPGSGHVCFIVGETPGHYLCLGGNQGDRVCVEAIGKASFVAFRWPPGVPIPANPYPMLTTVPPLQHLSEA